MWDFFLFFSGSRYGLWTPTTIDANAPLQTKSVVASGPISLSLAMAIAAQYGS